MIYKINLQLFAGGAGDKTEKATPKKRRDARKKGQVFQSREITSSILLLFIFIALRVLGGNIYTQLSGFLVKSVTEYTVIDNLYMPDIVKKAFTDGVIVFLTVAGPLFLVAILTVYVLGYAQVGFLFTLEPLKPNFSRISPLSGLKRVFSSRSVVELLKAIIKITVVGYVAYSYINGQTQAIMSLMDTEILSIGVFLCKSTLDMAIRICVVLLIIGVFDYLYQWWDYEKSMKMTKEEIKEEYKQTEGNPEIKQKIKQKQRQLSMRRMMQEVPKADVIITNPTHFACALKYDLKVSQAPVLIAKGQDYIAMRIKEIAKENEVEIVENKPLARTIYDTVEIGNAIPPELYQAVAEVLAFVYNLKGKNTVQ